MDMCDSVAHQGNLYGDTPLHAACYHGKLECVKRLLHASGTYSLVKVRFSLLNFRAYLMPTFHCNTLMQVLS